MLPLLPLDGGHVLFNVIEKIRGKSVSLGCSSRCRWWGSSSSWRCSSWPPPTTSGACSASPQMASQGQVKLGGRRHRWWRAHLRAVHDQHQDPRRRGHALADPGAGHGRGRHRQGDRAGRAARRKHCPLWWRSRRSRWWRTSTSSMSWPWRPSKAGVAGIRINPGNIGGKDAVRAGRGGRGGAWNGDPGGGQQRLFAARSAGDGRDATRPGRWWNPRSVRARSWRSTGSTASRCRPSRRRRL